MLRGFVGAFLLAALTIGASSCATITRGSNDVLVVDSDPTGAKVTTSNGLSGTTPATFKVNRRGGFVVKIEKSGYEPVEVQISSKIKGSGGTAMAGNILLGGLIGAAVDASTGAAYDLVPNPVNVKLVPLPNGPHEPVQQTVVSASAASTAPVDERARAAEALTKIKVEEITTHNTSGNLAADVTLSNDNDFAVSGLEIECNQNGVALRSAPDAHLRQSVPARTKVRYTEVGFGRARGDSALADCRVWRASIPTAAVGSP